MNILASYGRKSCLVLLLLNLGEYLAKAKVIHVANENIELDWWQTAVFYQIYPRSFKDSDGDGVGDIKGIEEKVEHLKDIGVDCVWLSPIYKSPMNDFGYDISNFNEIDKTYGTMNDFISLQKKLKSLGIKIIMDFVPNHTSDEHEWFKKSVEKIYPYTNYYVWNDGKIDKNGSKVPPNNWKSVFSSSAWTWNEKRKQYFFHQFDSKQPDLNQRNKKVVEKTKKNMRFWLDRGIDGYRVDAAMNLIEDLRLLDEPRKPEELASREKNTYYQYYHPYTVDLPETYDLVNQFRNVVDEYKRKDGETRVLAVEFYTSIEKTMQYYGTATKPGAHIPFNFRVNIKLNDQSTATDFNDVIYSWLDNMPPGQWANWVIGNHDQHRVATRFGPEMADGMNMLNLLLPGTAFTFMGEEIGMEDSRVRWDQTMDPIGLNVGRDGYRDVGRDFERSPYQWNADVSSGFSENSTTWLPVNSNYWQLNLAAQKKQSRSHYAVYKRLIALRKTPAIRRGSFEGHVLSEWVYAFTRSLSSGAETYVVVINLGSEYETVDLSSLPVVKEQHLTVHTSSLNSQHSWGDSVSTSSLNMRPKSSLVLTTEKNYLTSFYKSSRIYG